MKNPERNDALFIGAVRSFQDAAYACAQVRGGLALAVYLIGYGQLLATLGAACGQYATTVGGLHTMAETMLVVSLAVVGLECTFHCVCDVL